MDKWIKLSQAFLYDSMLATAMISAIILMNCATTVAIIAAYRYVYG